MEVRFYHFRKPMFEPSKLKRVVETNCLLGDIIKRIRKAKGLTQKELGEKLGHGKTSVQKYESSRTNESFLLRTLSDIADTLNFDLILIFQDKRW